MFFPDKIKNIKVGDRVLEVGPGSDPHARSDVLLEYSFDPMTLARQRGNSSELRTDKKVIYYEGDLFPFKDKEFDYVICSHVLEHVPNVPKFLSELFRVAHQGYVEYPTIIYEYLLNIDCHLNFLKLLDGKLRFLPKKETPLDHFSPVQNFMRLALGQGHSALIDDLNPFMFEGFEWSKPFDALRADSIDELAFFDTPIPKALPRYSLGHRAVRKVLRVIHQIFRK